ncbi:hypothetical protein PBI_PAEDORE_67 [Streptomyces phage Paedore]|uniref:Uncharacterized protein n=1 Tax=Streptomyces phage Paedore TaxID=2108134 RepID=A0A2P1JTT0_9CAUD|nr:hypothetical protein KGG91_gp67 [Streptomyces phage Paedore]AVO22550.1 hypothetical protein PBI_PAEDORE_67 [Streptomyces phage Paedore]
MARERDGWEYTEDGPRWAPTAEIAMSEITGGLYGHEYDETRRQLDELVRAAQRDAAQRLSEAGHEEAARLIFPTYPKENEQ